MDLTDVSLHLKPVTVKTGKLYNTHSYAGSWQGRPC